MSHRVLIVENENTTFETVDLLRPGTLSGLQFERKDWSWPTVERLKICAPQLIVAHGAANSTPLVQLLSVVRDAGIEAATLAIVPNSISADLFSAIVRVADDFLVLPLRGAEFEERIARLLGPQECDRSVWNIPTELNQLVGADPAFLRLVQQVPLLAAAQAPVLLTGETGTGKELFAHALHSLSSACNGPFIPVDCGAIPEHLLENELFGHVRGAYTDARAEQKGLVALAHGGTLFLDEVDALSLTCQSKLLRFLQEKSYRPLGDDQFHAAEVRIIAASNRDLSKCVSEKTFRADLFYRLNVLRLHLTALRERPRDVALLSRHFVTQLHCPGEPRKILSMPSLGKLERYQWPGNVRELHNIIQRAVVCTPGTVIFPEQICIPDQPSRKNAGCNFRAARADAIRNFELSYIESLLRKHSGNITKSAKEAGKDRRAFGRLVKKYSVDRFQC
jgi:transcriptional regulator with PAS, ATPase and Fis domain